ncbi:MAG: DHA2 family efflux MFS transporter permease subunit [Bacillota bacterium]|nr:DHA2 family efflux MFS transporter permease subunit [Bacillota bacterium]
MEMKIIKGFAQESRKHSFILTALVIGSFISIYQSVSLNVALPGFMDIFDTDLTTVQWLMTGFTLATGIIAPLCGYFGNRFGTRNLFLFSVAGLMISSIICALAWNIGSLIVLRIVQGFFCGIIQPVTLTIIYQMIPVHKRSRALGLWSAASVLGPALAPTISGWLQSWYWPLIFLMMIPFGVIAWVFGWVSLEKNTDYQKSSFDGMGMIGVAFGSLTLLVLFSNLHQWGLLSGKSSICFIIGVFSISYFIWRELRIKEPLLELRLFKNKTFVLSLVSSAILISSLFTGIYFIPLYLLKIHQMTATEVGLLLLPPALSMAVATALSSKYYKKVGPRPLILTGTLFLLIATWEFSRLTVNSTPGFVMLWMTFRYIGLGLSTTPTINAGMDAVPSNLSGDASSLINWTRQVTGAMSIGIFTSFFYSRMAFHGNAEGMSPEIYVKGLDDVFILATILTCLSIPFSLLLNRKLTSSGKASNELML